MRYGYSYNWLSRRILEWNRRRLAAESNGEPFEELPSILESD